MKNLVFENIRISIESIRSHLLRSILTIMIIAFGIMALVGIITAIKSIENSLNQNFAMMGANTFTLRNRDVRIMGNNENRKRHPSITYKEALQFRERYDYPASTSIYTNGTGIATLKYGSKKTDPNISVVGSDENYLITSGLELEKGRNFTTNEVYYGSSTIIIGSEIANKLFKKDENPLEKIISVGPGKYRVIGVLKDKGSSAGFNSSRRCIMPINNVRQYFSRPRMTFFINVNVKRAEDMEAAIGEATGIFRQIRGDRIGEPETFSISKSDSIAEMLIGLTSKVSLAAIVIGVITLLGAAIGLMNIMLVSVTERTREIGIRKVSGATKQTIRNQFFVESIVIGQFGGIFGIILGILIGNFLSLMSGSSFIVPWLWVAIGVALCFVVAILSGLIPALKAANLDPVESLRYE